MTSPLSWLLARLLSAFVPRLIGSPLIAFHEFADRLLPYTIGPATAYMIFYRYGERLDPGFAARRLCAFFAGSMTFLAFFEGIRLWGSSDLYSIALLPFVLAALTLAGPSLALSVSGEYGWRLALSIMLPLIAELALGLTPWMIQVRLWPFGILLVLAGLGGAWFLAAPGLLRRPRPAY